MSTRATYQFTGTRVPSITIYVHYDGYEAGAAAYFWAMHHHANKRGGFADRFLRANDLAELTRGHDYHGDTEYQYTLDEAGQLQVVALPLSDDPPRMTYEGSYWDFINAFPGQIEGYSPLLEIGREVWSRQQLLAHADEVIAEATDYAAKYPQFPGNISSYKARVVKARELLAEYNARTAAEAA